MAEYLSPGVYIEEVPTGTHPIPGVSTSTACDGEQEALERPSYFAGQIITAEDLTSDQNYHRERLRRHNRLLHGWGVVSGLSVAADPSADQPWRLRVEPGFALSPTGDEVLLPTVVHFDLAAHRPAAASTIFIGIRYAEAPTRPVTPGIDSMCHDATPSRIQDAVAIGCLASLPGSHAPVANEPSLCDVLTLGRTAPCPSHAAEPWVVLAQVRLPASAMAWLESSSVDARSVRRIVSPTASLQAQVVECCCGGSHRAGNSLIGWLRALFAMDR